MPNGQRERLLVGPFQGIEQLVSARHLAPDQLQDALNVVLRKGRLAPRPGFVQVTDVAFAFAPSVMKDFGAYGPFGSFDDIEVDLTNSKIYVSIGGDLWYMDFDGTNATLVISDGTISTFALDVTGTRIFYWNGTKIRVYDDLDPGGSSADVITPATAPNGIAYYDDLSQARIYYTTGTGGTIRRCWDTGTNDEEVCDTGGTTFDIDIDTGTEIAYFSNTAQDKIYSVPLGAAQSAAVVITGSSWDITRLALDLTNDLLYWLQTSDDSVRRSTLTGTSQVIVIPDAGGDPGGIALDPAGTRMYFFHRTTSLVFKALTDNAGVELVSATALERQLLGVNPSTEFTKDHVFFHRHDRIGSASDYGIWFPDSDQSWMIPPGYKDGGGSIPNFWCMNDRDADAAAGAPFSTKAALASFAYQGSGVNTGRGGFLIADGTGGYVANYLLGPTIQTVTLTSGPTGGTFTLSFEGDTTSALDFDATADEVRQEIIADFTSLDGATVVRTGAGTGGDPYVYTIRLLSPWDGKDAPLLTADASALTGAGSPYSIAIAKTQTGGTDTDATVFLLPGGIPRPVIDEVTAGIGTKVGSYSWHICFWSTLLGMESPPSAVSSTLSLSTNRANIKFTPPDTLYFQGPGDSPAVPFGPVVDKVRIYRKRWGSEADWEDGLDRAEDWLFVDEVLVGAPGVQQTYADYTSDADVAASTDAVPTMNEYPPANARYVIIHNQMAVWASGDPGDYNIWTSEVPKEGTLHFGELGYVYVRNSAFHPVVPLRGTDAGFTGLRSFGGIVLIGTPDQLIAANLYPYAHEIDSSFRVLDGAAGFASHHCILATSSLPDAVPALVWPNKNGWFYMYAQGETRLISREIMGTAATLVRKFWHGIDVFPTNHDSWFFTSAAADEERNRLIFNVIVNNSAANYPKLQIVLDLSSREWTIWDIDAGLLWNAREWDATLGVPGAEVVMLAGPGVGTGIFKMVEGKNDNGSDFSWSFKFGKWSLGNPFFEKRLFGLSLECETRVFDAAGADAAVSVAVDVDGTTKNFTDKTPNSEGLVHLGQQHRGKRFEVTVSGTQANDQDHAELIMIGGHYDVVGKEGR